MNFDPASSFGGYKQSGWGREMAVEALAVHAGQACLGEYQAGRAEHYINDVWIGSSFSLALESSGKS
jgi:hypothetical protein